MLREEISTKPLVSTPNFVITFKRRLLERTCPAACHVVYRDLPFQTLPIASNRDHTALILKLHWGMLEKTLV